jgi:hypothetical protein
MFDEFRAGQIERPGSVILGMDQHGADAQDAIVGLVPARFSL